MKKYIAILLVFLISADSYAGKGFSSGKSSFSSSRSSSSSSRSSSSFGSSSKPSSSFGSSSKPSSSWSSPSKSSSSFGSTSKPSSSWSSSSSSSKPKSSSSGSGSFFHSSSSNHGPSNDLTSHAQKSESKSVYTAPKIASKSTYTTPAGSTKEYSFKDITLKDNIQVKVQPEKIKNYETRNTTFYNRYYSSYPNYSHPVAYGSYNDYFNPFLMGWLMNSATSNQRAEWAYHHRDSMDDARYRELLKKDAELEAKVKKMEAEGVEKDPNYAPDDFKDDPDLMYNKDFVKDIDEENSAGEKIFAVFKWCFFCLVGIILIWVIFIKRF